MHLFVCWYVSSLFKIKHPYIGKQYLYLISWAFSGNSNGSIRIFGPDEDGQIVFLDRKLIHGAPVTDMSSYKQNLLSCDESGCTVLSKLDSGELMIMARSKMFGGLVKH